MGIKNLEFFDGDCLDRTSVLDSYGGKRLTTSWEGLQPTLGSSCIGVQVVGLVYLLERDKF